MKLEKPIGLALGCGAARGLAHFGVLKALKELDIEVDYIAGASIGAVVGAAHAGGRADKLAQAYLDMDRRQVFSLFDLVLPGSGLLEGAKVSKFVHDHIGHNDFDDLEIPLNIICTDLLTGEECVMDKGDLMRAIRASFAVPGVMTPVKYQDKLLVDGGMVNPVPVQTVRNMGAKTVIAVDVNHNLLLKKVAAFTNGNGKKLDNQDKKELAEDLTNQQHELLKQNSSEIDKNMLTAWLEKMRQKISTIDLPALDTIKKWTEREPMPGMFSVMLASVDIMERQIAKLRLKADPADVLIEPDVGHFRFLDFDQAEELIDAGYKATMQALKQD